MVIIEDNPIITKGIQNRFTDTRDLLAGGGIGLTDAGIAASGVAAGGSNTQIQFNDSGSLGGDAGLTYNKTTDTLVSTNLTITDIVSTANTNLSLTTNNSAIASDININLGNASSGDLAGGGMTITAGNASGLGSGGTVQIIGGDGSTTADSTGGDVILWGGGASGTTNNAGDVQVVIANGSGIGKDSVFEIRHETNGMPSRRGVDRILTTDGSATTGDVSSMPTMDADSTLFIHAKVVARRTGGTAGTDGDSAGYVLYAVYKKIGAGAPTLVGSISQTILGEDQAGWDATFVVSSNDVLLQVTGATNNNITWWFEIQHQLNT